ncbi:hypothetical protein E8E13_002917 [Curvularia kusanoi]|uniref:DUF7708 domain-containing protein n=1 Tax=Curvularia kusanoi TaxID=90978 RepID=A0A9P4TAH1_CURKU|nr:hypothetical protein E8E13_002917 [Curvularia kusanoi]
MTAILSQQSAGDLWADAVYQLPDEVKQYINFNQPDKLKILDELRKAAETSREESIKSRWKFTRKSGETVIVRDLFEKIIRWIDTFKQIGDVAVQYDPVHASLPWAGIRFLLQIAVGDAKKSGTMIESLAWIAEIICRYRVTEAMYAQTAGESGDGLRRAVVKLYASILLYLSKANKYFGQKTAERAFRGVGFDATRLDSDMNEIRTAEVDIDRWMALADRNGVF